MPVIVLAPVDIKDCYFLTMQAFNLAEKFRYPVFIASNKEIATIRENIDIHAMVKPEIIERSVPPPGKPFVPFKTSSGQLTPYFLPIGGDVPVNGS